MISQAEQRKTVTSVCKLELILPLSGRRSRPMMQMFEALVSSGPAQGRMYVHCMRALVDGAYPRRMINLTTHTLRQARCIS